MLWMHLLNDVMPLDSGGEGQLGERVWYLADRSPEGIRQAA